MKFTQSAHEACSVVSHPASSVECARADLVRANFSELEAVLDSLGVASVDIILADLGVSTDQLLDPARVHVQRGFSARYAGR